MPDDKITATELSTWLLSQEKKAAWLAKTIGVTPATVSRWLSGKVIPSGSDESLLRLLVRGEMPFDMISSQVLRGVMDFTEDQWRVIATIAGRHGMTPGKWIAEKVRWILAGDEEARGLLQEFAAGRKEENGNIRLMDAPAKVAENAMKYGKTRGKV